MCKFCSEKEFKEFDYIEDGQRTMRINMQRLFGKGHKEAIDGVQLLDADGQEESVYFLMYDNSSGEYAKQGIAISYCPFCGKKLK